MDKRLRVSPALLFVIAATVLWQMPAFAADALYGTTRSGNLFVIDLATGAGTQVGTLTPACGGPDGPAPPGITEIEYDPISGRAFSQDSDGAFCGSNFLFPTGTTLSTVSDGLSLEGMEVVSGTWYAAGYDGISTLILATFNPTTGVVTPIGPTGLSSPIAGLAWNGTTMYGISGRGAANLYTMNLATGAATLVGATGIQAGSLEFGPDGQLYAGGTGSGPITTSVTISAPVANATGNLYRINTATGLATLVGPTGFAEGITGLVLAPTTDIPALGTFALLALGFLLAVAGAFAVRV